MLFSAFKSIVESDIDFHPLLARIEDIRMPDLRIFKTSDINANLSNFKRIITAGRNGKRKILSIYINNHQYYFRIEETNIEYLLDIEMKRIDYRASNENLTLVRMFLTSRIIPFFFSSKGLFLFHASAVFYLDHAIAFLADHGVGKSTIVALLIDMKKYQFISDDIICIKKTNNQFIVYPSYDSIRLWNPLNETAEKFADYPNFTEGSDKKIVIANTIPKDIMLINRLYILKKNQSRNDKMIKKVKLSKSVMMQIINNHFYGTGYYLYDKERLEDKEAFITDFVNNLEAYLLLLPYGHERLKESLKSIDL